MTTATISVPVRCELQHQAFATLGELHFVRAASDGVPMMAMRLGEREALLSLKAVRREFAIDEDSADGRMLDLIGSALEHVPTLQPGDRLPPEICTGEASWDPDARHRLLAAARLRLAFVSWIAPESRWAAAQRTDAALLRLAEDAALVAEMQTAAILAAKRLRLESAAAVVALLDGLAHELGYIEALRERLLAPVGTLRRRVARLLRSRARPAVAFETLAQVHRLIGLAERQLATRLEDVDAQTGEVAGLLRNAGAHRQFIRSNRDALYQSQRAWEPVMERWRRAEDAADLAGLVACTYQFLAPRFAPTRVWQRTLAEGTVRQRGAA